MRKIVINTRFGGFGLSRAAFLAWARRKDFGVVALQGRGGFGDAYWAVTHRPFEETPEVYDKERHEFEDRLADHDIQRDDPDLVAVVEELGEKAAGLCARLKVVEIPSDVEWHIEEYDGSEHVAENHRTWS